MFHYGTIINVIVFGWYTQYVREKNSAEKKNENIAKVMKKLAENGTTVTQQHT